MSSNTLESITALLTAAKLENGPSHDELLNASTQIQSLPTDQDEESIHTLEEVLSDTLWPPSPAKASGSGGKDDLLRTEAALSCLNHLITRSPSHSLLPQTLLHLTAYTNPQDPWTSPPSSKLASSMLAHSLPLNTTNQEDETSRRLRDFIVDSILQSYLRPLFSKATGKVTSSGRPSAYDDPTALLDSRLNQETPAWKKEGPHVVTVFRWAVAFSDETLIKENWPLFTPVLLTIAESEDSSTRQTGLQILSIFIQKCPSKILQTTGIGTVFEETIFPSLLHLPSLTPEAESVGIMTAAYDALTGLVKKFEDVGSLPRRQLLDRILRRGVFTAYDHASQYIGVVEALMGATSAIVDLMGIYAVKHLQNLISMISSVMTDPFTVSHPSAILAGAKALNACLSTCWPRITSSQQEQGRIFRVLGICWLNIRDSDSSAHPPSEVGGELTAELKQTVQMMNALRETAKSEPLPEMAAILTREPSLQELFQA